jgi:predicted PurR-regulated permease PerM
MGLYMGYRKSVAARRPGTSEEMIRRMSKNSEERFQDVLFYGVVLLLLYLVFRIFEPFLIPLGWAGVFAVIFYSLHKRLERRWGPIPAASLSTIGVTLLLIVPVLILAMLFVREGIGATRDLEVSLAAGDYGRYGRAWQWLSAHLASQGLGIDLTSVVRQGASRFGEYMASQLGAILRNIVVFLFEVFVMLFALFYFFLDGDSIMTRLRDILPFEQAMRDRMLAEARDLIFASVTTSLVIAAVQGLICGAAFAIVGLSSPVFWGVLMAFLSLLPIVGAWPIWVPGAIWLFSTGHYGRAIVLIAICGAIGSSIDNVLRPILLGGRASLGGLLIFISVLGGIAVFGILGVVLGPIVLATAVGVLDVYAGKSVASETAVPLG